MGSYSLGSGLSTTTTIVHILFVFGGIALYNTIELLILALITFKRYRGLYFWSLILSTAGIIPYTLGLLFNFFNVITIKMLTIAFIDIGWQLMVTGQSIVMYSRLHLLATDTRVTKFVLAMIITNWFISNVPTTVFVFGANSIYAQHFNKIYGIWERLQLCLYFVQEITISGLYIFYVVKLLQVGQRPDENPQTKSLWERGPMSSSHSRKGENDVFTSF
jgi:hypothetical protein